MKPANSRNDELLKKYMKHLPKTMLEEAKNASPALQKLSAGTTGRSGNANANKKWSRIGAIAGAAAALVICVVAGIVIAIKLPKTVKQPDDMTQLNPAVVETPTPAIDTGTTSPAPTTVVTPTREAANTPEVTNIPKVTPISTDATPTAGPTAGSTAIPALTATTAPTATPAKATTPTATTAPTATPTKATTPTATTAPTATPEPTGEENSDSSKEEKFQLPVYSAESEQEIIHRITTVHQEFTDVIEYAEGYDRPEEMVFYGRYYNTGKWTKKIYKYDQLGRRVYEQYRNSEGRVELSQVRYDEAGNTSWTKNFNVFEDGTWDASEFEPGVKTDVRKSDGTRYYCEIYPDTGTVRLEIQYTPEKEGNIEYCYAKYYDKNGNVTLLKQVVFIDGNWLEKDYVEQPPTPTAAPTATPEPTPSLPFVIPSGLREFTVKVDNNLASEYPGTRPAKVSYGENGFWFETVNVVRPGTYYARSVEGGDLQTYTVNSDIYFHFEYTGEISTIDNIVSMNIDRVRVWLEFTSGSDRETLKRVVAALSQSLSSDYARKVQYGDVSTLLSGEKIVYNPKETGYLLGDLLCFSRDNVRGLAVQKNGDNVLLSYIDVASSTNITVSSDGYNYSYSGGTLTTVKHYRGTYMISSREYSGGELIRSYERINEISFVEYFNDKDNSRTVTTTVKGNNKVTVETYQDRADLLALITKETVSENDAKYKYTETTEYYKAAGSPETWTESQITRNVNGADWVEVVRKYDINGNPVSVVSDNSYGTHSEEIMVWNERGVNVESRGFMTQNGEKVNETASRRNDSGVLIYSYNVWYDSRYFSEQVYNDEGVLLIDRVYDKDTGTGQWYGYARYYDESGTLIEEKTIVFENGKWIEI